MFNCSIMLTRGITCASVSVCLAMCNHSLLFVIIFIIFSFVSFTILLSLRPAVSFFFFAFFCECKIVDQTDVRNYVYCLKSWLVALLQCWWMANGWVIYCNIESKPFQFLFCPFGVL